MFLLQLPSLYQHFNARIKDKSSSNSNILQALALIAEKNLHSINTLLKMVSSRENTYVLQGVKKVPDPKQNYIGLMTEG